jgi:hypothetical protein
MRWQPDKQKIVAHKTIKQKIVKNLRVKAALGPVVFFIINISPLP